MNKLIKFSFSNLNFNSFIQKFVLINASHVLNWKHLMFGKIRMVYHIWQNLNIYFSCWTPCVGVKLMSHLIHCALVYYFWLNFKKVVMGKEVVLGGNYIENKHVNTCLLLEEKMTIKVLNVILKKKLTKVISNIFMLWSSTMRRY